MNFPLLSQSGRIVLGELTADEPEAIRTGDFTSEVNVQQSVYWDTVYDNPLLSRRRTLLRLASVDSLYDMLCAIRWA
jgi:hypothetical protein